MTKTYAIPDKTRIGVSYRTTVPGGVGKLLKSERGDKIVGYKKETGLLWTGLRKRFHGHGSSWG